MRLVWKLLDEDMQNDSDQCLAAGQQIKFGSSSASSPCSDTLISNCVYTCTEEDVMSADKLAALTTVLDDASDFFTRTLAVEALAAGVQAASQQCAFWPQTYIPAETTAESDFVLYVTLRPNQGTTLATAVTCQTESSRDRPIVGWANFAPRYLLDTYDDVFNVAVHEVVHALGFSYDGFLRYRKETGDLYSDSELFVRESSIVKLKLPTALGVAQDYIGCDSLDGLELEDDGGAGTALSHWEKRVFGTEFMTGSKSSDAVISRLTFAALADSSWYQVSFSHLPNNVWGAGKGCSFVNGDCLGGDWDDLGFPYTCQQDDFACSINYAGRAVCDFNSAAVLADSCPILTTYASCKDVNYASEAGVDSDFLDFRAEVYSADSICVPSTLTREEGTSYTTAANQDTCMEHYCAGINALKIRANGQWRHCSEEGDKVLDVPGYEGEITCPDVSFLCQGVATDREWPTLTVITPKTFTSDGGERVIISGRNLLAVTEISLSGVACTNIEAASTGRIIECTTEAGSGDGTGVVTLLNERGQGDSSRANTVEVEDESLSDKALNKWQEFKEEDCGGVRCYIWGIIGLCVIFIAVTAVVARNHHGKASAKYNKYLHREQKQQMRQRNKSARARRSTDDESQSGVRSVSKAKRDELLAWKKAHGGKSAKPAKADLEAFQSASESASATESSSSTTESSSTESSSSSSSSS